MMVTKAVLAGEMRAAGVSGRVAARCLDALLESLGRALAGGEAVELRGLGSFSVSVVAARKTAFNESAVIPAHGRITFRPSRKLRRAVWGITERRCGGGHEHR